MRDVEVIEILESNYGLKKVSVKRIKAVYRVHSEKDTYCLKVIPYELSHFLFIVGAMKHLQSNGFRDIPAIIPAEDGRDYVEFGDGFAYLTLWLGGRESFYDNPYELAMAAVKLGELHNASEDFQVKDYMKPRVGWFKWIEVFRTRRSEIVDFKYRILDKSSRTKFDMKYMDIMEEELERCDRSIENLLLSNYEKKCIKEVQAGGFCHHDYANHNVLINGNAVNIIDFDYCILDLYLHDLSSLLIRSMKYGKWDESRALIVLRNYKSVHRLEEEDRDIILGFMEFPQDYWQRGIQYYWENQPWDEEFFLRKLRLYEEDRNERQKFIDRFREFDFSNI